MKPLLLILLIVLIVPFISFGQRFHDRPLDWSQGTCFSNLETFGTSLSYVNKGVNIEAGLVGKDLPIDLYVGLNFDNSVQPNYVIDKADNAHAAMNWYIKPAVRVWTYDRFSTRLFVMTDFKIARPGVQLTYKIIQQFGIIAQVAYDTSQGTVFGGGIIFSID